MHIYQAVKALVTELNSINKELLSDVEHQVLHNICEFLYAPHTIRELLLAKRMLTLSLVLPIYEQLIILLKSMMQKLNKIQHAIATTIRKLKEYLNKSQHTCVYALAISTSFSVAVYCSLLTSGSSQSKHQTLLDQRKLD